jgi:hypothetical protein
MRQVYGLDADFLIDSSCSPLVTMILALRFIDKVFFERFQTDPDFSEFSKISENIFGGAATWREPRLADANLFDSAYNATKFEYDDRETGIVINNNPRIELGGLQVSSQGTASRARINDFELNLTSKQASKYFSINNIRNVIMGKLLNDPINKKLYPLGESGLYAVKRAGDWGQVENCRKYDKVFFTSDRLAALYAQFRGVKFVFMAFEQEYDTSGPAKPFIFRYTFVLRR